MSARCCSPAPAKLFAPAATSRAWARIATRRSWRCRWKTASPISRSGQRLLTGALVSVRKPTIAALPGPAVGAGLAIAMACDIRIAAQSAFVATGYARIALSGDYGIAWLLTRLVGTARARELLFTGDRVDAARCEAIGLVNRVVPDNQLQAEAFALAKSLAEGPRLALRYMKDNLDEALQFDFETARDHEAERLIRLTTTADHKEAVQAFIEKRKAVFRGK
ncbi:enoyl-CoA hydratase/carnithine racemase [Bradyrhizobium sp. LB9.1b]